LSLAIQFKGFFAAAVSTMPHVIHHAAQIREESFLTCLALGCEFPEDSTPRTAAVSNAQPGPTQSDGYGGADDARRGDTNAHFHAETQANFGARGDGRANRFCLQPL